MGSVENNIYLIIGGAGFLGKNLVIFLLARKVDVVVVGTRETYHPVGNEKYVKSIDEVTQCVGLDRCANLVIVDLAYASVPNTSFEDPINDFSRNLYNIIKHLEFAKYVKCRRYVYVSSGGTVYGDSKNVLLKEEDSNYPISPYGITKMACERYVQMYHVVHHLNTCIIRPSNVYGPEQKPFRGQGFIATTLALILLNKPAMIFGNGNIVRDYLFVKDFCSGVLDVILYGANGQTYNLGYGRGHSINEAIETINVVVSKEERHLNVCYKDDRPFDVKTNVLDIKKIQKLNGWRPEISFEKGIGITWQWMKKRHLVESL